jgi:hypothetical protein
VIAALRFLERYPVILALAVCALAGGVAWARASGMSAWPAVWTLAATVALLVAVILRASEHLGPEDQGSVRGRW